MNTIVLCGMPGSGKTAVGQILADTLQWPFIDTDRVVERIYSSHNGRKASCREIFQHEGEQVFRTLETMALSSLHNTSESVIALGWGALLAIRKLPRFDSTIVYLKADSDTLDKRLLRSDIPAYLDTNDLHGSFDKLLAERTPLYEEVATTIVDTDDLSPDDIVSLICTTYQERPA